MSGESNEPSRACTSCDWIPTTFQTTVVPTFTVRKEGEKKCSAISIMTVPDAIVAEAFALLGAALLGAGDRVWVAATAVISVGAAAGTDEPHATRSDAAMTSATRIHTLRRSQEI